MVQPLAIAAVLSPFWRWWTGRIAFEPLGDVEVVDLLAPDQAGKRLSLYPSFVLGQRSPCECCVELVRFRPAVIKDEFCAVERIILLVSATIAAGSTGSLPEPALRGSALRLSCPSGLD